MIDAPSELVEAICVNWLRGRARRDGRPCRALPPNCADYACSPAERTLCVDGVKPRLHERGDLLGWPDEAFPEIGLDAATALVVLAHDPKLDDSALLLAQASDCFYVGALGSRATHAWRIERLFAKGVTRDALARIRAPIGLDIGALGPAEIAVSALGELIL